MAPARFLDAPGRSSSWSKGWTTPPACCPTSRGKRPSRPSPSWPTPTRSRSARSSTRSRGTARSTRRSAGRRSTTSRSSSSTCRPTSSSVCRTAKSNGWRRSGARPTGRAAGPWSASPSRGRRCTEQIADLAGERDYDTYWERHFEHNPEPGSYHGATTELGRVVRELEEDEPRLAGGEPGARGLHAPPDRGGARVGTPAGPDRRRGRRLSRPGADRRIPGHDGRRTGVAAAPVEQADAHAVLVLPAVVAVRVRGRQSRPGVLRAALAGAQRAAASATCPAATCRWSPATSATPAPTARRPR